MVPSRRRRWARRSVPSSTPRPTWHDAVRRDHPTGAPVSEPHKTDARLNEARMNVQNPDELPEPPRRRLWFRKKRYLLSILSVVFMIIIGFTFGDTSPPRVSDADDAPTSAAEAADVGAASASLHPAG